MRIERLERELDRLIALDDMASMMKFVDNLPSHLTVRTRANGEYFNPRLLFMSRNNKVTDWSNKLDYKLIWNVPKGY